MAVNDEIVELQMKVINRMKSTPVQGVTGDSDEYKDLLNKLKTLTDISCSISTAETEAKELEERRYEADSKREEANIRASSDRYKADVDERKSRRDNIREFVLSGLRVGAGYGAIILTGVLESDKLIRSKAWSFASKAVSKFF